jgi:hypothetical protein
LFKIFNANYISELIQKLGENKISINEEDYLHKIISLTIIYNKNHINKDELENIFVPYFNLLVKFYQNENISQSKRTEYFFLKNYSENFLHFKNILNIKNNPSHNFSELCKIWDLKLLQNTEKIFNFFNHISHKFYRIPKPILDLISQIINKKWKGIRSPISIVSNKMYTTHEIKKIFANLISQSKLMDIDFIKIPQIDRFFSLSNSQFGNIVCIPENDLFTSSEASLIFHELIHILDCSFQISTNQYHSERFAVNGEYLFLKITNSSVLDKHKWIERNFLYPLAILEWEINSILSGIYDDSEFQFICKKHSLDSLNLSNLFNFNEQFQFSLYCASILNLEKNWQNYIEGYL